jgi:hypothetical protein
MTMRASAADILQAGVTIEPEEAVAIVQQLIAAFRGGRCTEIVEPPFGPPTAERVVIFDDGSVGCRGCETTPAVSEIALLLEALLPPAPARVPGGLRYTIARALLDVDVPPFDSLDELSETLARYERGPREPIVIALLQRVAGSRALVPVSLAERRRAVRATELRRALREADARLYVQRLASEAVTVSPRSSRGRTLPAALAGLAAGALMMVTGEFMHHFHRETALPPAVAAPPPVVAPVAAPRLAIDEPVVAQTAAAARPVAVRHVQTHAAAKRPPHATRVPSSQTPHRPGSRGVLDRLRLRWLRDVFTRADL